MPKKPLLYFGGFCPWNLLPSSPQKTTDLSPHPLQLCHTQNCKQSWSSGQIQAQSKHCWQFERLQLLYSIVFLLFFFPFFFPSAICSDSCRDCNRKWGKNIRKPVYRELFAYSEAPEISWEPWHTSLFQPSFTNWRALSTFQINIHISMYYYSYLFMLWQDKEISQD